MSFWSKWKRSWRNVERSRLVRILKRRVRQLLGTDPRHFIQVRRPTAQMGGWTISTAELQKDGVAYCFGIGDDATFDRALVERFGLEVHSFDPTPRAVEWVRSQQLPPGLHFHPVGLADYDGTAEFAPSSNPANPSFRLQEHSTSAAEGVTCSLRRLSTLAGMLEHTRIDLLKMDIEGMEYEVIDDMLASDLEVRQILVEFHHRFKSVGRARTEQAVKNLQKAGYRIFYISPHGREYSFIHESAAQSPGSGSYQDQ